MLSQPGVAAAGGGLSPAGVQALVWEPLPPAGPFLPPPLSVALAALLPAVPQFWNSCVCKLPREGRAHTLVRRAPGLRNPFPRRGKAEKRQPALSSVCGCNCVRPHLPLGPRSCLRAACRWQTAAKPLQHPKMGGRKMGAIAEGEEREMVGGVPVVQEA